MKKLLFFANFLMLGVFILKFNHLPPQIPLFYSRRFGEEQLADLWMIVFLPFFLNFFFFINNFFYKKFFFGNFLVKKIVDYVNLFLIIIIPIIFLRIIFLIS
jgi:hypothetical protein